MKHTPGPWKACQNGKCKCKQVWSETADHPVAVVESGEWGDSHWKAELVNGEAKLVWESMPYGEISESVAIANARLISAAPELLDVCKAVLSALNSHQAYDKDMRPELRAAIAKAEGKLPSPYPLSPARVSLEKGNKR